MRKFQGQWKPAGGALRSSPSRPWESVGTTGTPFAPLLPAAAREPGFHLWALGGGAAGGPGSQGRLPREKGDEARGKQQRALGRGNFGDGEGQV